MITFFGLKMAESTNKHYIVITGDIISSRQNDAAGLMENVPEILRHINTTYNPISKFQLSAGDEIQGLLKPENSPFHFLLDLTGYFYPLRVKFGIGLGSISTEIKSEVGQMRGEAFEFARAALNSLSNNRILYSAEGYFPGLDSVNTMLMLFSRLLASWDERVFRRYKFYLKYGSIHKVAEQENVSAEAINKHLNTHSVREILATVKYLDDTLLEKYQP
jgi:predicted DNA-binding protein YlxM (UPF0122 family)